MKDIPDLPPIDHEKAALTHNLTGGQIQSVLDDLIYNSLAPLVKSSDVFDIQIVYLLGVTARNRKRKLSALPREEFITSLCHCLITDDRDKKIHVLTNSKIERGFVYNFVVNFLKEVAGYTDLYRKFLFAKGNDKVVLNLRLKAVEQNVGNNRAHLFSTINIANDYLELAYEFRNAIVSNYLRQAYKQARSFCAMKGPRFDFEDVFQNFLAAITKAVDKYDCSKGALTSYINWWIINAQTCTNSDFGFEYGTAYTIPQLQRKAMAQGKGDGDVNYAVSLDAQSSDDEDGGSTGALAYIEGSAGVDKGLEEQQELDLTRYLAKCADIHSLARLYLDLDEVYSKKELKRMRSVMIEQGTATQQKGKTA
jgi:hypothetical protein